MSKTYTKKQTYSSNITIPEKIWTVSAEDTLQSLNVSKDTGLKKPEIKKRRNTFGSNVLKKVEGKSVWQIFIDQFKSLVIGILAIAAVLSFLFGQWVEGIAVSVAIILNALIGFFTEYKAQRSMEALRKLSRIKARVRRDGEVCEIPADQLVVGDVVILDSGDIVTADLRLVEANKLQADESPLTGESVPVGKQIEKVESDTPLAERRNMLYKGTYVTRGSGEGVVTATGMDTELGTISQLVEEAEEELTPLEQRLNHLGRSLIWITLALAGAVTVLGIIRGKEVLLMVESGVALAVAAIPEGLPIVATVALARGMMRMARRNALINRLASVETLGATNIICTDKTGTLTENKMTVSEVMFPSHNIQIKKNKKSEKAEFLKDGKPFKPEQHSTLKEILKTGVLCNNASLHKKSDTDGVGDPVEVALLSAGAQAGLHREEILKDFPEVREEAFDPDTKMMATFHKQNNDFLVEVKGAPESVLEVCSSIRKDSQDTNMDEQIRSEWINQSQKMAERGLRILAVAQKNVTSSQEEPYQNLIFLGLIGMYDPPRKGMDQTIKTCRDAGIRVIMVTGDHPETARKVALAVKLTDEDSINVAMGKDLDKPENVPENVQHRWLQTPVFSRVSPEQKLNLIDLHQKNNSVVAMTGDGINDAPALKKADIGIAMGKRGTQVAKEASDMILKDDAFSTIEVAIEQGRIIFKNIRKFILFLLSGNVSEILILAAASLMNWSLPLLPLQILFLNLVLDVFPALALGVGEGNPDIMKKPPRNIQEPVITRKHWMFIVGYSIVIAVTVLTAFRLSDLWLGLKGIPAVTVSFFTLAFARLWHVFNMRDAKTGIIRNEVMRNPFVWGAIVLCIVLILSVLFIPVLSKVIQTANPGLKGWGLIVVMSFIPWIVGQVLKETGVDRL